MSRKSRAIIKRIVVEGDLVLLTPTSLGNGDADGLTDMPLLTDALDGSALLTGTSIAGALRNYLRECESGYGIEEGKTSICRTLFGFIEDKDGSQSCLIIDDSIGDKPRTELRDGVRIKGETRTAYVDDKGKGSKFDIELLEAETRFTVHFELVITQDKEQADLISAFATALEGFERGEIFIGARKRRGYGECKVSKWRVKTFDLVATGQTGLMDWLRNGGKPLVDLGIAECASISSALGTSTMSDQRAYFELKACFALDGSMLIRSGSRLPGIGDKGQPDTVHLRSKHRDKGYVPVVSGTSLAGVLRHRAVKICNTIANDKGKSFVENIFGVDMEELKNRNDEHKKKGEPLEQPFASRLEVKETSIENTNDLVQTRVKIDRFTGGASGGALFDAAPVFAKGDQPALEITLKLRNPQYCEIGLLLLLLKDLWTSDLPIGGESSIGRGRLKGMSASLRQQKDGAEEWNIESNDELNISENDRSQLNAFVTVLNEALKN